MALCSPKPRATSDEVSDLPAALDEPPLLLLLEGVEDARDLGFTLRRAEALRFRAVLIKKHLWDLDPVEIARPASGAYERVPLVQIDGVAVLAGLPRLGLKLYGCLARVKRTIANVNLTSGRILAIGGENRGLSGAVGSICDAFVTIPTRSDAASLSLSHASAIVMAEATRQRLGRGAAAPA